LLFQTAREEAHANNSVVANNTLRNIVTKVEKENGLEPGTIKPKTVKSRIDRNNVTGFSSQRAPMLSDAEQVVVDYFVKMANMGVALDKEQMIRIAEAIAIRYDLTEKILAEKRKRNMADIYRRLNKGTGGEEEEPEEELQLFGSAWYIGFMRRNEEYIKENVKYELRYISRHYLIKLHHFKEMYDLVYDVMVNRANIAEKIRKPTLYTIDGVRISNKNTTGVVNPHHHYMTTVTREYSYGLPTRYRLTKPDFFLFVDEVGSRSIEINQNEFYRGARAKDSTVSTSNSGHIGGQTFVLPVAMKKTDENDEMDENENGDDGVTLIMQQFTVYCFHDANGKVVLCTVIFKSDLPVDELPLTTRWGLDISKPLIGDDDDDESTDIELLFDQNCGPNQAMRGGPCCYYNGIDIPCVVGTSASGVMTSDVLLEVCTLLDNLKVYDRSTGSKPFLLLDGHNCVLDISFIDYIHDEQHEWVVCCGLHRDSHLLQVADPNEFILPFKDELALAKDSLITQRIIQYGEHYDGYEYEMKAQNYYFYPSDIIPLVHQAWTNTYNDDNATAKDGTTNNNTATATPATNHSNRNNRDSDYEDDDEEEDDDEDGRNKTPAAASTPGPNGAVAPTLTISSKLKRSLALRGWYPMNYALLLHPMLNKKEQFGDFRRKSTQ
jgi:hypothetical protein